MERTYVFNQDGGAASGNGLLASILPSLQNRGVDTGYLMGLLGGGNGNGGFFGNNGGFQDIIALIVIAAIFGNGNFGFGGNNNQGANEGREMIMQTLNRNGVDIASLAQAVNTSSDQILAGINSVSQAICGLGNQMGQNTNSILTAIMQGNNALTSQICSCCCDMKQLVATQGYESQLAMCNQTNTLVNTANQNTLSLRDSATANTQAIIAKLDAMQNQALLDKIDALREAKSALQTQLSQEHQTSTFGQMIGQATAPLGAALGDLSSRLAKIECKQPETVTVPYSPIAAVPNCVAYQYGLYGGFNPYAAGNGFWG